MQVEQSWRQLGSSVELEETGGKMYGEEGREDAEVAEVDGGEGCAEEDLERFVEEVLGVRKAVVRCRSDCIVYVYYLCRREWTSILEQ